MISGDRVPVLRGVAALDGHVDAQEALAIFKRLVACKGFKGCVGDQRVGEEEHFERSRRDDRKHLTQPQQALAASDRGELFLAPPQVRTDIFVICGLLNAMPTLVSVSADGVVGTASRGV